GGAGFGGLGDSGDRVGVAAALVHAEHRHFPARARVRIGHRRGAALVARGGEPSPGVGEGAGQVEVARSHHPESVPDPAADQGSPQGAGEGHRSTSASTRAGEPEPGTIFSGEARMTAPVVGSWSRFCNCARPYLPAPMKKSWHGKIGSNPAAAPASVPTVSTPRPCNGVSSAMYFA